MKRFSLCLFCFFLSLPGCYYTVRAVEGSKISAVQVQEIKLGKTTEAGLLKNLGPPARQEHRRDGTDVFYYRYFQVESPTLPGGYVVYGLFEKEDEEIFEVTLKDGVVQSYHFTRK